MRRFATGEIGSAGSRASRTSTLPITTSCRVRDPRSRRRLEPQIDRERAGLAPVAGGPRRAVERGDADALLAPREGFVGVEGEAGVGAAGGAPGPQLDPLGAVGPRPLDDEGIGGGQAGVEAGARLVDAAAHAERADAVAERAEARPPASDGDRVGAGAVERQLDARGGGVDEPRGGALLRGDVPDERPELERGADRERGVAEAAGDAGRAPG